MIINKIKLSANTRSMEISLINSVAKYLRDFNDSLLIENELDLNEIQLLNNIFAC
ncbi:hypothetical protein [Isorropodon fossajaponicum symbiont]|uniref:hypothetical protein n=1 Tax=Isorropodon fossajaponicum symbiont TaxID=883811 RepID=UPI001915C511|nr:hypothetical protein [Isorropodon fossajaponicum symbiont]